MYKFKYEFEFGTINVCPDDVKYFKFNGTFSYFHSWGFMCITFVVVFLLGIKGFMETGIFLENAEHLNTEPHSQKLNICGLFVTR